MCKIGNKNLYEAVFEAAIKKVERNAVPDHLLLSGVQLYRAVSPEHMPVITNPAGGINMVSLSSVNECLKARDQSIDRNRFSGVTAAGVPGPKGAVYFFKNQAAGLAELMHYAERDNRLPWEIKTRRVSVPHLMATKAILIVTLKTNMLVADLSIHHQSGAGEVRRFLNDIGREPNVSKLLAGKSLPDMMLDETDYSVSRAVGHAVQCSPHLRGMIAQTARQTERLGETGSNICLFARPGETVSGLKAETALYFFEPGVLPYGEMSRAQVVDISFND